MPQYHGTNRRAAGCLHFYPRFLPFKFLTPPPWRGPFCGDIPRVISENRAADTIIDAISVPLPGMFGTAHKQLFAVIDFVTFFPRPGCPEAIEAAFIAHPEYDEAIT